MRIHIGQRELQKHIQIAQRAISSRNTVQILDGILLEAKGDVLTLQATDLEIGILTAVPCIVEEEGTAVVKGNLLSDIVRKLPHAEIRLEAEENRVAIQCLDTKYNLVSYSPEEYPTLMKTEGDTLLSLPGELWRKAIRQTLFATSQEDTKPVLRGILLDIEEDKASLVALDGFRIALRSFPTAAASPVHYIIPGRTMGELLKIIDDDQIVQMTAGKGSMSFAFGDTVVTTRLLEGQFIQYKTLLQTEEAIRFEAKRSDMFQALERASLLSGEDRANLVKLSFTEEGCTITSNTDLGHVFEKVTGTLTGEPLDIAFNARYLMEGFKEMEDDVIEMDMSGPLKPCLIRPQNREEQTLYLVLPVRMGQDAR